MLKQQGKNAPCEFTRMYYESRKGIWWGVFFFSILFWLMLFFVVTAFI